MMQAGAMVASRCCWRWRRPESAVADPPARLDVLYARCLVVTSALLRDRAVNLLDPAHPILDATLPIGLPWLGAHFRIDALVGLLPRRRQSRRRRGEPLRARLWPARDSAASRAAVLSRLFSPA